MLTEKAWSIAQPTLALQLKGEVSFQNTGHDLVIYTTFGTFTLRHGFTFSFDNSIKVHNENSIVSGLGELYDYVISLVKEIMDSTNSFWIDGNNSFVGILKNLLITISLHNANEMVIYLNPDFKMSISADTERKVSSIEISIEGQIRLEAVFEGTMAITMRTFLEKISLETKKFISSISI